MIDPLYGVVVLVCGMIGLWVVAIAFSINLMFWGRVMGKIKLVCSWVELQVIKAVLYSVAVIAAYASGSAFALCLIIPSAQMLGWM